MSRISFEGFNNTYATFEYSGNVKPGDLVKIGDSGKIVTCTDGDVFIGVCANKRDNIVTVQLSGYAEFENNGEIEDYGFSKIICSGNKIVAPGGDEDVAPLVKIVKIGEEVVGFIF